MTSYSPGVLLPTNSAPVITISGLGLDIPSVRTVRFEPATTCTLTVSGAAAGTINGTVVASVGGSNQTLITVSRSVALPSGFYSVCVDYTANPPSGHFISPSSSLLFVREYIRLAFSFAVTIYYSALFLLQRLLPPLFQDRWVPITSAL